MTKTFRETALLHALAYAGSGVHETGRNNRSGLIDRWNKLAGVPLGSSWCMAFVHGMYLEAGLDIGGELGDASVGYFEQWAQRRGDLVARPQRADVVCFEFDADNWPDHVGLVVKVLKLGPYLTLRTVEGNTGPAGSVSDPGTGRDAVRVKTRIVRVSRVRFARVKGRPEPHLPPETRYRIVYRHGVPYTEPVHRTH